MASGQYMAINHISLAVAVPVSSGNTGKTTSQSVTKISSVTLIFDLYVVAAVVITKAVGDMTELCGWFTSWACGRAQSGRQRC